MLRPSGVDTYTFPDYYDGMTHDSAVRIVVGLVPSMEEKGAEATLTKYASDEDLPPAQLEKLGQVYNTLRTVSHIDNAEDSERGATVPLLDVPGMVVGYATGLGQEKRALAPLSFSSHNASTVDLTVALHREMQDAPVIEKAASDNLGELSAAAGEDLIDAAGMADTIMHLELDLRDEMSKLACDIYSAAPKTGDWSRDISEFEREALYSQPQHLVKAAGDFLEEFAAPHHVTLNRHDYSETLAKRAYEIPHHMGGQMAELAEVNGTYGVVVKLAAADPVTLDELDGSPEDQNTTPPTLDPDATDPEAPPEDPPKEGDKDVEGATDKLKDAEDVAAGTGETTPGSSTPPADDKPPKDPSSDDGKGKGGGVSGAQVLALALTPSRAAGAAVRDAAVKVDETLARITSKERQNKEQQATDISVEDIKRAMNLRRMIGTDPVLKEADPREVLEVYNAIAEKNPEIANNMASLRLILREAVSYEGLTLDSQKMLSEIRHNSARGLAADDENDKKRYAVGGASPIQLTA